MTYKIISTCTACGACLPACPIDAISVGDPIYVIDRDDCCDFEDCLAVCPVDAIVPADTVEGPSTTSIKRTSSFSLRAEAAQGHTA